jgi:hypothetical protein
MYLKTQSHRKTPKFQLHIEECVKCFMGLDAHLCCWLCLSKCSANFFAHLWTSQTFASITTNPRNYTDKKEKKILLIHKKIKRDRVQSHIWLTASSYMGKNLRNSSYIRGPFPSHLDFLIYEENLVFFFCQCSSIKTKELETTKSARKLPNEKKKSWVTAPRVVKN